MTSSVWWRDFNQDKMTRPFVGGSSPKAQAMGMMDHRNFMNDCIRDTRGMGSSGFVRAVKPYQDARDKSFYIDGASPDDARVAGYKAMMAHYNMPAPDWAWWA
tara:strand:+ start:1355 stop:1663 length:309 start_codon:yes stop_codon:yes gene_type:complete